METQKMNKRVPTLFVHFYSAWDSNEMKVKEVDKVAGDALQVESESMEEPCNGAQKNRFLIFRLDGGEYGIEISKILEIIAIQPITPIPESAPYIKGIINLRGKIVTVMDMRLKLQKQAIEYNDRTCVIIIDVGGVHEGIIVDSVVEAATIADGSIAAPPKERTGFQNQYIYGISSGDKVRFLLDCERLISDNAD